MVLGCVVGYELVSSVEVLPKHMEDLIQKDLVKSRVSFVTWHLQNTSPREIQVTTRTY
jgi:hypothetical protein